jgi:FKBP-type peptidyl-prolyl cis-trans isomerase
MKVKKEYWSISVIVSVLVLLMFSGCLDSENMSKAERKSIENYLKTLGDTVVVLKPSGLYYIELIAGTGISPVDGDTVVIRGRGMYLDYVEFSSNLSNNTADKFVVGAGDKIKGIEEGVKYIKVGGKARLLTPSSLAYGYSFGPIPLLWDVTLVSVTHGPGKK